MNVILLKQLKAKTVLTIMDNSNNVLRQVSLIKDHEYILNPINKRFDNNRGRKVIFKSIESTRYCPIAKVKYLDTLRPGKVQIDDLDNITSETGEKKVTVQERQESFVYSEFIPMFQLYLDILNVIDNRKDSTNIAYITQHEIAEQLTTSSTNVSKRLKQLIRYGSLEKISPGVYKLLCNSIWYTPYRIVHEVIKLISEKPELIQMYKEQAKLLDVSLDDISQAWSFINLKSLD